MTRRVLPGRRRRKGRANPENPGSVSGAAASTTKTTTCLATTKSPNGERSLPRPVDSRILPTNCAAVSLLLVLAIPRVPLPRNRIQFVLGNVIASTDHQSCRPLYMRRKNDFPRFFIAIICYTGSPFHEFFGSGGGFRISLRRVPFDMLF